MSYRIFGREPALVFAFLAVALQAVATFVLPLSETQQASMVAVAVALTGFLTAWRVVRDKVAPAVLGLAQAVLTLALAFGANFSSEQQGVIMAFVTTAVAMYTRTQVTAVAPPETGR